MNTLLWVVLQTILQPGARHPAADAVLPPGHSAAESVRS
jgi:hypothetical protein